MVVLGIIVKSLSKVDNFFVGLLIGWLDCLVEFFKLLHLTVLGSFTMSIVSSTHSWLVPIVVLFW